MEVGGGGEMYRTETEKGMKDGRGQGWAFTITEVVG